MHAQAADLALTPASGASAASTTSTTDVWRSRGTDDGPAAEHAVIPEGIELIAVDREIIVTPNKAALTVLGAALAEAWITDKQLSSSLDSVLLALMILEQYNDTSAFFKPYWDVMPQSFDSLPLYWPDSKLEWLNGSHTLDYVGSRRTKLRLDFELLSDQLPASLFRDRFTFQQWMWAKACVSTRTFGVEMSKRGHRRRGGRSGSSSQDSRADARADDYDEDLVDTIIMVPFADMINHGIKHTVVDIDGLQDAHGEHRAVDHLTGALMLSEEMTNAAWYFDNDKQQHIIESTAQLLPGQQVLITYGARSNSDLLSHYGFALEHNPVPNDVQLQVALPTPQPGASPAEQRQYERKVQLLGPDNLQLDTPFTIADAWSRQNRGKQHGETTDALSFLRVVHATDAELDDIEARWKLQQASRLHTSRPKKHLRLREMPIGALGSSTEQAVQRHLATACHQLLTRYPTTLQQDLQRLSSNDRDLPPFSDRRNALLAVAGEKKTCQYFIDSAAAAASGSVPRADQGQWLD